MLNPPVIDDQLLSLIHLAVAEDLGTHRAGNGGDLTVNLAIPTTLQTTAAIIARKPGTLSGTFLLPTLLHQYSPHLTVSIHAADGSQVVENQLVAEISGPARALLSAERMLLNFLGHMSGIASQTHTYLRAIAAALPQANPQKPLPVLCDTRKTIPGYRALDKYAVRCGGGVNHRMGLYDGVMLKDNHLAALREQLGPDLTLAQLTMAIRQKLDPSILLWLEVDTLEQLKEALQGGGGGGADIILLDNFSTEQMRAAVGMRDELTRPGNPESKVLLEASGGITLENIGDIARTGIDRISIGALTHSAPVLDISMEFA
ncbi:MAG TPA: carboxylating nicotinate-nucleotide diphosphorylase [Phycisphaerae bacterium]|jgi:nicotinate-nucleotide pyrophosphorylase (carboxylating)